VIIKALVLVNFHLGKAQTDGDSLGHPSSGIDLRIGTHVDAPGTSTRISCLLGERERSVAPGTDSGERCATNSSPGMDDAVYRMMGVQIPGPRLQIPRPGRWRAVACTPTPPDRLRFAWPKRCASPPRPRRWCFSSSLVPRYSRWCSEARWRRCDDDHPDGTS